MHSVPTIGPRVYSGEEKKLEMKLCKILILVLSLSLTTVGQATTTIHATGLNAPNKIINKPGTEPIVNNPVMQREMQQRDVMTANREARVWAIAKGAAA